MVGVPRPVILTAVVVSALLLAGCGGEEEVRDASNSTSVIAGADQLLQGTGVRILDAAHPNQATTGDVVERLTSASIAAAEVPEDVRYLTDNIARAGGLVSVVGPPEAAFAGTPFVVLVFETPTPAILFARDDLNLFVDDELARGARGILAGNVLAVAASTGVDRELRSALAGLSTPVG